MKCLYEGRVGYFAPSVFLNSRSSIPAGREIYGTTKVFAEVEVKMVERVMITETNVAGTSIMTIRSTMHRPATIDDMPQLLPAWRLKVIPGADGKGADVMQLIDAGSATSDVTTHIVRAARLSRRVLRRDGLHGRVSGDCEGLPPPQQRGRRAFA